MAREIITYDNPEHDQVVGIDRQARRVTFYHCEDRYAISVAIESDGLADGGTSVARFDSREAGVKRWVGKMGSYWGWVHPRCR